MATGPSPEQRENFQMAGGRFAGLPAGHAMLLGMNNSLTSLVCRSNDLHPDS